MGVGAWERAGGFLTWKLTFLFGFSQASGLREQRRAKFYNNEKNGDYEKDGINKIRLSQMQASAWAPYTWAIAC